MDIRVKRIYEEPADSDGCRVLVDRVWPRGVAKLQARLDRWLKEVAPSTALRQWFAHDPAKWADFRQRYFRELDARTEDVAWLREQADRGRLTLLFAAKDESHNNALVLRDYLKRAPARGARVQ